MMDTNELDMKKAVLALCVCVIVITASIFLITYVSNTVSDSGSDDPDKDIGEQNIFGPPIGYHIGSVVDPETESGGKSVPQGTDAIDYNDGKFMTQFVLLGLYDGKMFVNEYLVDDEVVMKFNYDMVPDDWVIECAFVPEIVDGVLVVAIYVDEDFRYYIGDYANIVWGPYFENEKKFDYSQEYSPGIYRNVVSSSGAFIGGTDANVAVGGFTKEDAATKRIFKKTGFFLK